MTNFRLHEEKMYGRILPKSNRLHHTGSVKIAYCGPEESNYGRREDQWKNKYPLIRWKSYHTVYMWLSKCSPAYCGGTTWTICSQEPLCRLLKWNHVLGLHWQIWCWWTCGSQKDPECRKLCVQLLQEQLLTSVETLFGDRESFFFFIFQQDNASCHNGGALKRGLKSKPIKQSNGQALTNRKSVGYI